MVSSYRYFTMEEAAPAAIVHITESQLSGDVNAEVLKLELAQLLSNVSPRYLLVDFRSVKMIGSSFISTFLALKKRLDRDQVRLMLCDMPASVRDVYRTLHLEGTVFEIFESVPSALRRVTNEQSGLGVN